MGEKVEKCCFIYSKSNKITMKYQVTGAYFKKEQISSSMYILFLQKGVGGEREVQPITMLRFLNGLIKVVNEIMICKTYNKKVILGSQTPPWQRQGFHHQGGCKLHQESHQSRGP
jgi:hypothetical protein